MMCRKIFIFVIITFFILLKGADWQVFYSENATGTEKHAATEIAGYLSKISGSRISCTVEISGKPHPYGIFVGRTAFASAKGVDVSCFDQEEWLIRRFPDGIIVTGGRPRGTLFGAYEFLERFFGIMWLDETFTHIPRQKKITLPEKINLRCKPHFRYRGMYTWYGKNRWQSMAFRSRNRENIFLGIKMEPEIQKKLGHHPVLGRPATINTLYLYVKHWPKTGMEQGYSLNHFGKRVRPVAFDGPGQVCFSSKIAREKFAEQLIKFIREDRKDEPVNFPRLYNISVHDVKAVCHCQECRQRVKKYGSESGGMLEFINFIAEKVEKVYPDIRIQTSAYLDYEAAPLRGIAPRKNVTVRLSPSRWGSGMDTMLSLSHPRNALTLSGLKRWGALGSVQIWNYWVLFGDEIPDINACLVNIDAICDNLRFFSKLGADYVFSECEYPATATFQAMRVWVGYKLKLEPFQNVNKLIDSFMAGYYGKAAGYMRKYYDYIVKRQKEVPELETRGVSQRAYVDETFFITSEKLIQQALDSVAGNTDYIQHIINERVPLDIARLVKCPEIKGSPFTAGDIHKRLRKDWRSLIDRYCKEGKSGAALLGGKQKALQHMNRFLKEYSPVQLKLAKYPVPEKLRDKKLLEICWQDFNSLGTYIYGVKLAEDPDSPTGRSVHYVYSEQYPQKEEFFQHKFTFGVFDRVNKKPSLKGDIPRKNIHQDEKFHVYDLGKVTLTSNKSLLWIHHSWWLQQNLGHLYRPGKPEENTYRVYVSLKFTGPAYVRNSQKSNGFYMDRILLVREPARM
ncbi:MAG: DUF4838 domain-containing protein [Lentisphaerae bacterium]|nr:DUF4838 domain-containing protein [Lentisphaerota bacterium]